MKKGEKSPKKGFQKSLETLVESKIFNSDVTLDKLVEVSAKLNSEMDAVEAAWCFITRHYIYYGEDKHTTNEKKTS